eukprot:TRINITY_DN5754_c0_g3_i1.p1 TRINITY_DN5754_c0_g3~~TRINITY_DN5754_c0_g3_i1.p1  ORF type:complete len:940 (+),score=281.70 TRINITY_DN5754_c0_g3_i1:35-2821(+)
MESPSWREAGGEGARERPPAPWRAPPPPPPPGAPNGAGSQCQGPPGLQAADAEEEPQGCSWSVPYLLALRPCVPMRISPDIPPGITLIDVLPEDRKKQKKKEEREEKKERNKGPIGPITECLPVDAGVLKASRRELKRIEQQTGAIIKERAGLRGYTVMISGTTAIVEEALPLVEQALAQVPADEPTPVGRQAPLPTASRSSDLPLPADVPVQQEDATLVGAGDNLKEEEEEDWEIPEHWKQTEEPQAQVDDAAHLDPKQPEADIDDGFWEMPTAAQGSDFPPAKQQTAGDLAAAAETADEEDEESREWASVLELCQQSSQQASTADSEGAAALPGRWRKAGGRLPTFLGAAPEGPAPPPPPTPPPEEKEEEIPTHRKTNGSPPTPERAAPAPAPKARQKEDLDEEEEQQREDLEDDDGLETKRRSGLEEDFAEAQQRALDDAMMLLEGFDAAQELRSGDGAQAAAAEEEEEPPSGLDHEQQEVVAAASKSSKKAKKKKKSKQEEKTEEKKTGEKTEEKTEVQTPRVPAFEALDALLEKGAVAAAQADAAEEAETFVREVPSKQSKQPKAAAKGSAAKKAAAKQKSPAAAATPAVPAKQPASVAPAAPAKGPAAAAVPAKSRSARDLPAAPAKPPPAVPPEPKPPPPAIPEQLPASSAKQPRAKAVPAKHAPPAPAKEPPAGPAPKEQLASAAKPAAKAEAKEKPSVWAHPEKNAFPPAFEPVPVKSPPSVPVKAAPPAGVPVKSAPGMPKAKAVAASDGLASQEPLPQKEKQLQPPPRQQERPEQPLIKAVNPLPQRAAAAKKAAAAAMNGYAAAASLKWMDRPVERIQPATAYYEEEEDPDLQCYLWDRQAQQPKVRAAPKQHPVGGMAASAPRGGGGGGAPAPQKQRAMLSQVMDMGFDEPSAKRALTSTGWAGVEEAVTLLLGS